eukprot:3525570-Prorocentrum_lima.AAC.1
MLLHATISGLAVLVLQSWGAPARVSTLAGAIFASHPVHVEAVANVAGRAEMLSALMVFAVCLLDARCATESGRGKVAAAVLSAAAMLSKETGIMIL